VAIATPFEFFGVSSQVLDGVGIIQTPRKHNYGKSPFLMGKSTINGHVQ